MALIFRLALLLATAVVVLLPKPANGAASAGLTFFCRTDNDLYQSLGARFPRHETVTEAISNAPESSAVLLLADDYPSNTVPITMEMYQTAASKRLRLFVEYPECVPGISLGKPRTTPWARVVAGSNGVFNLPPLTILSAHECFFLPATNAPAPDLFLARVAGYSRAAYGIPNNASPILFKSERKVVIATTRLSGFVSGRFAPTSAWGHLWRGLLSDLAPGENFDLKVTPVAGPMYPREVQLPKDFESLAFKRAAGWFANSKLLVTSVEKDAITRLLQAGGEDIEPAAVNVPLGDGTLGILEGYSSGIRPDGSQRRRLPLRADCNVESAMVLALDGWINKKERSSRIASNLLDFVYHRSGMCQGPRSDPKHGAYGLIGWGDIAPAWLVANYGDDNARAMLATAVSAAALGTQEWDKPLMRALLANLRTTGKLGFRGDRIDIPALDNGWKPYFEASPVNRSPHFESYLWAAYLWAYARTGYAPFLERTRTAISMTMEAYPHGWRWQDNLERAHMLLCLAWLTRVDDTPEHRGWLSRVATDLLASQDSCGAIRERLGPDHGGHYQAPRSNEEYGTGETPLLHADGDPVSDQLYTTGFALLGLHEAVGATGDSALKQAEKKLAEYLCRIQIRAPDKSWLDGQWFRAFDFGRWEAWGSSADVGWGAWSIESGWAQAWTAAILALREKNTTVWEFTSQSRVRDHFESERQALGLP